MTSAIVENQDKRCELCGRLAVGAHRILHASLGGKYDKTEHDHNNVVLCPEDHARAHAEKFGGPTLDIRKDEEGLLVIDRTSGEVLLDRPTPPEWFNLPQWMARFQRAPGHLRIASQRYFRFLPESALTEVAHILDEIDDENWAAKAKLLQVAKLRIPWGERQEKWDAIIQDFGLKKSQAYKLVKALDLWETGPEFQPTGNLAPPPPDTILLIAAQGDPVAAMELYEDRKANNPRYSTAQLREDLKRGNTSSEPEPKYCTGQCLDCGRSLAPHVRNSAPVADLLKMVYKALHKLRTQTASPVRKEGEP